jgi:23S rRNA (cytidine1920-2'-O)/16S rRNA (cytidine1409-2'-O)-methyltransferase
MTKMRADQLLVKKGLVNSRETARRLILAGKVLAGTARVMKAGQLLDEAQDMRVVQEMKYVSRGGYKLEHALKHFDVDVAGKVILDVGASTGGFTDCLLQYGAQKIYALDVGYGQIAWKLRQDPRVIVLERMNARHLSLKLFSDTIDLAVVDVSFIGSSKILDALIDITNEVLLLLKPQFEAGPQDVPKGGVIKDVEVHRRVLLEFYRDIREWKIFNLAASPISGADGNLEFLVHLKSTRLETSKSWDEQRYTNQVEELLT